MVVFRRAYTNRQFPELLLTVPLSSWWATAIPHLCRRCSNASRCVWFSLLWGHCSFPLGPGAHKILCVPSRSGVSVSPSPVEILQSNPAGLQSQILWGFPVLLPDHQSGKPDLGLRNFTPVGEHLSFNHYPVWGSPTQQVWDLILSWLCPSYHLIAASPLSLDVGYILLGGFQCLPVIGCSALSCDFGALARGGEHTSFYSAILNQSLK